MVLRHYWHVHWHCQYILICANIISHMRTITYNHYTHAYYHDVRAIILQWYNKLQRPLKIISLFYFIFNLISNPVRLDFTLLIDTFNEHKLPRVYQTHRLNQLRLNNHQLVFHQLVFRLSVLITVQKHLSSNTDSLNNCLTVPTRKNNKQKQYWK